MRLLCLVTATLLAATTAASASPDPFPFEVVNVLRETQQVLVYDRAQNTHVLLTVGSTIDNYKVLEIRGIGLTVEKDHQQFTVYPRAARSLALFLIDVPGPISGPPAIYSGTQPAPAPALLVDRGSPRSDAFMPSLRFAAAPATKLK